MNQKRTLLGVFAHPDDESFGPGGTLARYGGEGGDVHVIIATDGIAGSVEDPNAVKDHETLAQVRSAELANAAVALEVTSIWSLPYRDSGMRGAVDNQHPNALIQQPIEALTEEILGYIQRLRPQVIITHDPFGGYGHPDHICVCEATTAAFHLARGGTGFSGNGAGGMVNGSGPQKLYYTAFDKRILKVMVRLLPLFGQDPTAVGRNQDINFAEIARWETPIHTSIDVADYLPQKLRASQAHVSQFSGGPSIFRILPGYVRRQLQSKDRFTRAYPTPSKHLERDLFAGVA